VTANAFVIHAIRGRCTRRCTAWCTRRYTQRAGAGAGVAPAGAATVFGRSTPNTWCFSSKKRFAEAFTFGGGLQTTAATVFEVVERDVLRVIDHHGVRVRIPRWRARSYALAAAS